MSEKAEEKIIKEFCVSIGEMPGVGIFKVMRGFYLKDKNGPPVQISPGMFVEVCEATRLELFSVGRIEPLKIPIKYKVVRPFRCVLNGLYCDLRADDLVQLDREEGLRLWRHNFVLPEEVLR
jgi:hypothetical protein